jgi:membrane associated rhomboid family serine protease
MGMRFGPGLTPTIKMLLAANVTVFLLQAVTGGGVAGNSWLVSFFGLVPQKALTQLHVWQFVSYMFLHGSFGHILMNMFMLWMFGTELERLWGPKLFLQYYAVTGVDAGLIYGLLMALIAPGTQYVPLVGASGAVYGVLTATALLFPDRKVLLYFLIPIKIRWLMIGYVIIEMMAMWSADGVGHLAHLGGVLFGYLYLRGGRRMFDDFRKRQRRKKAGSKFRVVKDDEQAPPSSSQPPSGPGTEVDRILEKISREGYDSLTPEELDVLRRASKH